MPVVELGENYGAKLIRGLRYKAFETWLTLWEFTANLGTFCKFGGSVPLLIGALF